jgi:GTP-binding protein EngB required for normal cell division
LTLLSRYETLRRKEFEALTPIVDTLNRVDLVDPALLDQARDALFHADHPYLIVLLGGFNTGKSSILNALIGDQALGTGATPTTDRIILLRHGTTFQRLMTGEVDTVFHPSKLLEQVSLVDSPGLESIFKGHDEITRRFLHRADAVFLVMLATQAMSQSNVEYLQSLRAYGKRIIILINQIDLLDDAERAQLHEFVLAQARQHLETEPEVWLTSAKLAQQARETTPRDPQLWEASGFGQIERFILQTLDDAERVRGKLETPLQIIRNVSAKALAQVRDEQNALSNYRKSAQNVRAQIDQGIAAQRNTVDATATEIGGLFDQVAERGAGAIREVFQLGRAPRLTGGGLLSLVGLGAITRSFGGKTPAKSAFESAKVAEPLERLPALVENLAPRLEGRDVQDTDDLVSYTKKELQTLPEGLRGKLVGSPQVQRTYERTLIPAVRPALDSLITRANAAEFERIDRAMQSTVTLLAIYEIVVFVLAILTAVSFGGGTDGGRWVVLVLGTLGLMALGLLFIPVRGVLMANAYKARIAGIKQDFQSQLRRAADAQIAFGQQMRTDAVTPFLRLVDAQTGQVDMLKTELERGQQTLSTLERELTALRA